MLIVRTSALGDIVRTVPALARLRQALPHARIDWLINDGFAEAIRHHPALSAVVPFPRRALSRSLRAGRLTEVTDWARRALREPSYDLVIDFQGLLKSGLLTFTTGAERRVGFADAREGAWLGYTERAAVAGGRLRHHTERVFELVRAVMGAAEPLTPSVEDLRLYPGAAAADMFARDTELAGRRYVLLSPTTKGLGRAWPMERYAALARSLLARRAGLRLDGVVVVGLESERALCGPLLTEPGLIDRIGATGIGGLMSLIQHAALVVCNDSAAMHMAVAFDRPLVALFGPTDVGHAGPWRRDADVITHKQPGEQVRHRDVAAASAFMRRITVEEVVAASVVRLRGGI